MTDTTFSIGAEYAGLIREVEKLTTVRERGRPERARLILRAAMLNARFRHSDAAVAAELRWLAGEIDG